MMKIVICDDEKRICDILAEKVEALCPDSEVVCYSSGEEFLTSYISPDILLLDIRMPGLSGMDVASSLRDRGWRKILIFITGEEDQVFASFDLHPFHFLVKPVLDEKLREVLTDAKREIEGKEAQSDNQDRYINVQSGTEHIRICLSRMVYAEVFNRKIILHMENENIEYYGQLSVLEELAGDDFYRVHRSYLVHMKYIERYDRSSVRLQNGDSIPIARRGYEGFLRAYLEHVR